VNLTTKTRIKRFSPLQRLFHALLMLSFLVQGATGLARMYTETPWGRGLGGMFGGYEAARTVHIYVGIFMLCGLLVHVFYLLFKINWQKFPRSLAGPDSLLPRPNDIKQFFQHIAWFMGIGKPPAFDRWGYWEKFDYWAVFWGLIIIGTTGLLMAFPLTSSRIMPGWGLNVAFGYTVSKPCWPWPTSLSFIFLLRTCVGTTFPWIGPYSREVHLWMQCVTKNRHGLNAWKRTVNWMVFW